jgi:hypothetical protein
MLSENGAGHINARVTLLNGRAVKENGGGTAVVLETQDNYIFLGLLFICFNRWLLTVHTYIYKKAQKLDYVVIMKTQFRVYKSNCTVWPLVNAHPLWQPQVRGLPHAHLYTLVCEPQR